MTDQEIQQDSHANEKVFRQVSHAIVTLMMVCAALTVVSTLSQLLAPWQPWYIVVICFLVTLDRLYTRRFYKTLYLFTSEWLTVVGTQLIVILVLAKIVVTLSHGPNRFWAEILPWQQDLTTYFWDPEFLILVTMIVLTWVISGDFADLLEEMGLGQEVIDEDAAGARQGKAPARERLLNLFFSVGSVLVVFTALGRFDMRVLLFAERGSFFVELPALAAGGASTLLYFMLGLALLSQTQLMALHVRWNIHRVPVSRKLAGRWALYSILFLVFMAAIVSLLPTSYSLNPLAVLGYILNVIVAVFLFIAQYIIVFVLLLLNLSFQLLGVALPAENGPAEPLEIPPPLEVDPVFTSAGWWEFVKSLAFWVVFLGVLIFAAVQYLRQHEEAMQALRKLPGWIFLERAWQWFAGMFLSTREGISRMMAAGQERLRNRQAAARKLFGRGLTNLRGLDPRQRVTVFYLALVRRGAESGLPRSPAQTPYEYAARLEEALPTAGEDIQALTEAFIEARYSSRPVQPEKANLAKAIWERVRKALRRYEPGKAADTPTADQGELPD
jgi:hypothetical protein